METTACHFHCSRELGNKVQLRAGDDAGQVMWLDINLTTEPRCGRPTWPSLRSRANAPANATRNPPLTVSYTPQRHLSTTSSPPHRHLRTAFKLRLSRLGAASAPPRRRLCAAPPLHRLGSSSPSL
eukprot:scaffold26043_cov61-Phaeocystis_antarctica.AAC.3